MKTKYLILGISILGWLMMADCEFPTVEEITKPGEIRIWFNYDLGEGTAFENIVQENDSLKVICTNFRLYNDTNYTDFYQEPDQFRQDRTKAVIFNLLDNKQEYVKIAHGSVPPYEYTKLQFQMSPLDTAFVIGGQKYPLTYQGQGAKTMVSIETEFPIAENQITDIYLTYYVNEGIRRLGDKFYFSTVGDDSTAIGNLQIEQE
ncbi:MAG: hypothetical protein JXQ65_00880 [Candidatus Marinimicrobia bacterium]|nr:hypothetical protein [Candidatus Neomarinimicrobiota bacterium]